jgi:hypothetical protein
VEQYSEIADSLFEVAVGELGDVCEGGACVVVGVDAGWGQRYWLMVYCSSREAVEEPQTLGPMRRYWICAGVRERFYSIYETNRTSYSPYHQHCRPPTRTKIELIHYKGYGLFVDWYDWSGLCESISLLLSDAAEAEDSITHPPSPSK